MSDALKEASRRARAEKDAMNRTPPRAYFQETPEEAYQRGWRDGRDAMFEHFKKSMLDAINQRPVYVCCAQRHDENGDER